jgi:hypothetical protein
MSDYGSEEFRVASILDVRPVFVSKTEQSTTVNMSRNYNKHLQPHVTMFTTALSWAFA